MRLVQQPTLQWVKSTKNVPVAQGFMYFGVAGQDPKIPENQITVFRKNQLNEYVEVQQPISLSDSGVPIYLGQEMALYVEEDCAIRVDDRNGAEQYLIRQYFGAQDDTLRSDLADGTANIGGQTAQSVADLRGDLAPQNSSVAFGGDTVENVVQRLSEAEQRIAEIPDEVDAAGTAATLIAQHNSSPSAHPELTAFITSEADRAESAADAAELSAGVYPDTATGLAAVAEGEYFSVPSAENDEYLILYRDIAGVAVEIKRYPSTAALNDIPKVNNLKFPAISDANGVELLGFNPDGSAVFKVSPQVIAQLDRDFASQLETAGLLQESRSVAPAIFSTNFFELLGFDLDGNAHFSVSKSVAQQVLAKSEINQSFADKIIPYLPAAPSGFLPVPTITCWGDSMTEGSGGSGTTITTVMATELGRTINNRGKGGQDTLAIAVRQGGEDLLVTVSGNSIPASVGVAITAKNSNILSSGGVFTGTVAVTIAGIAGIISTDSSGNWTFTRSVAGSITAAPVNSVATITGGTAFIADPELSRDDTIVIWSGRNGVILAGRTGVSSIRDNIISMVEHLTPLEKRLIVVSVCNGRRLKVSDGTVFESEGTSRYEDVVSLNAELAAAFPLSYVDLRGYMVNHAIYDAGLTPTATDLLDIDADCIPTSLMADDIHFNATGYQMAGKFISRQIKARGW